MRKADYRADGDAGPGEQLDRAGDIGGAAAHRRHLVARGELAAIGYESVIELWPQQRMVDGLGDVLV